MAKNKARKIEAPKPQAEQDFFKSIVIKWLGFMCFFITVCFFLQTRDSAQVKATLLHAGAFGALGLWAVNLYVKRVNIFTKRNFKLLLPFILYFVYVLLSYFFKPYLPVRSESLLNFILYSSVFIIAAFELNETGLLKISNYIIAACWVAFSYGILQIINNFILPGADPLFWSDYFQKRIFSTSANPNFYADFCLFSLMIIAAKFLHTKDKKLLVLGALGLINIFFTESKGAWLALGVSAFLFVLIYFNYFTNVFKENKVKITAFAMAFVISAVLAVSFFAVKRMQSVNFRVYTWKSALEMIKDNPLTGRGAGSFFIAYSEYKKPEIFYMEGRSNAQTHHAENHYIELLATLGVFGFALFLYCTFYILKGICLKLKNFDIKSAEERSKQQAFLLLAYAMALASIYIHNFVDISIYLPSTGFFVFLFLGAIFNLTCGPLETPAPQQTGKRHISSLFFVFALLLCAVCAAAAFYMFKDFAFMTMPVFEYKTLLFAIYWVFFLFCVIGTAYVFIKTAFKSACVLPCIILSVSAGLMYFSWGFMKADNYISGATSLAEKGEINTALIYYTKAIKLKPFNSSLYQFRAVLLGTRMDLSKTYRQNEGDCKEQRFNDYERALRDYAKVVKLNPNEPLLYYYMGTLERNMALKADAAQKAKHYKAAREYLERALTFDPVFDNIYFQLANLDLDNNNPRGAYEWLLKYRQGPPNLTNEEYVNTHKQNEKANSYIAQIGAYIGK